MHKLWWHSPATSPAVLTVTVDSSGSLPQIQGTFPLQGNTLRLAQAQLLSLMGIHDSSGVCLKYQHKHFPELHRNMSDKSYHSFFAPQLLSAPAVNSSSGSPAGWGNTASSPLEKPQPKRSKSSLVGNNSTVLNNNSAKKKNFKKKEQEYRKTKSQKADKIISIYIYPSLFSSGVSF